MRREAISAAAAPRAVLVLLCIALLVLVSSAPSAHAAKGTVAIWGSTGSGAGQLSNPQQLAVNWTSHEVYAVDAGNNRISVFDSFGTFRRAWGWGVVASGPDDNPQNEQQTISVEATGGYFRLSFIQPHSVTPPISYDATAAEVQSALEGLSTLDPGDIGVSGAAGGPWTVDFAGNMADRDVSQILGWNQTNICSGACNPGVPTLTGEAASLTISTVIDGANFEICEPAAGDTCRSGQGVGLAGHAGQLSSPTGIAINQATGDVFIGDQGNRRVQSFDAAGNFLRTWGKNVDPGGGDGFEVCTVATSCQAGESGSGNGEILLTGSAEAAGGNLAIDPNNGSIFLADLGNHRVQQFTSAGGFVGTFGSLARVGSLASGDPGFCPGNEDDHLFRGAEPVGIAIGSEGTLFTTHEANFHGKSELFQPRPDGSCGGDSFPFSLKSFTITGGFLGVVSPAELTGHSPIWAVADPGTGHAHVVRLDGTGGRADVPPLSWQVAELDASGQLLDIHAAGIPEPSGITVDASTDRLYVATEAGDESRILVLDEVANPPTATIAAATAVTATTATLNGSVNPGGEPFPGASTGYHFDYRAEGEASWTSVPFPDTDVGAGTEAIAVSKPVVGLDPNTTYEVRLVASRKLGAGNGFSAVSEFTSDAVPPAVASRTAFPVTDTEATLRAVVDAKHSPTSFYFQYGTEDCSANPCTNIPAGQDGDAGSALGPTAVQAKVLGLAPETTYHFRVLAANQAGADAGDDGTFTTTDAAAAAWPARGIELVSPPEKANQQPLANRSFDDAFTPTFDNDRILWITEAGIPGSLHGTGDTMLSERTPSGWRTHSLLPSIAEQEEQIDDARRVYEPLNATKDFSSVLFRARTFNGLVVPPVIVRREASGDFTRLFADSDTNAGVRRYHPSGDLSRVFVNMTREDLGAAADPSHLAGTTNLYDIGTGTPELASRMPNGTVPSCGIMSDSGFWFGGTGYPWTTRDGSKLFFESQGSKCSGARNLYLRDLEAGTTTLLSSPGVGDSFFIRANESATAAVFISSGPLVKADGNANVDVYRWDASSGVSCLSCVVIDADVTTPATTGTGQYRGVVVSPDLSHAYFVSANQLVSGEGTPGTPSIYSLHDGTVDFVAPYGPTNSQGTIGAISDEVNGTATNSDGTVLLFASEPAGITPDDPGICHDSGQQGQQEPCRQVYRYEEASGSVECVTCRPPGTPHAQRSYGVDDKPDSGMSSVAMSADGRTVVFISYVPYVARDINGSADLYEWRDGRIRLVTDGATEVPESLLQLRVVGLTPDASSLFFLSAQKLTGHEVDQTQQLYDARVGGGFPPPQAPPAPCVEDACQGPLQSPPTVAGAASASFAGPGNQSSVRRKPKRRSKRKTPRRKCTRAKQGKKCAGRRHKRGRSNGGRQER